MSPKPKVVGVIKSSFVRNPNKSSQVVATQISSFIPSTKNIPPLVNEVDKGLVDLDTNYQLETLEIDQDIDNLLESEEINNPFDL